MAEEIENKDVKEQKEAPKKDSSKPESKPNQYKKKVVEKFSRLIKQYPIVGAVNMEGMPAGSLQKMKAQLRDSVVMLMSKRRLMKVAIENCKSDKKGIEELIPYLKGMPAMIFTKDNPFSLFKTLKANKSPAPAKAGQEAPKDIIVPAGPTPFAPGPIIGELGALKIKTEVKDGKIAIRENSKVAKEGDIITAELAGVLTRLGIFPMEIGLDLTAVYEDGVIYNKKILDVDEKQFAADVNNAARWAFNLAVESGYFTKETVSVLVPKAFREAKAVALEAEIINDATRGEILGKAERQALSVKKEANIPDAPAKEIIEAKEEEIKEELKEVKKEIEKAKEDPSTKEVKKIEKEVKKIEEEMEEVAEMKAEVKEKNNDREKKEQIEAGEKLYKELQKKKLAGEDVTLRTSPVKSKPAVQKKSDTTDSEKLYQELKQTGTLRNHKEKKEEKPKGKPSPQDIINRSLNK